jgi:hypothetical protein
LLEAADSAGLGIEAHSFAGEKSNFASKRNHGTIWSYGFIFSHLSGNGGDATPANPVKFALFRLLSGDAAAGGWSACVAVELDRDG